MNATCADCGKPYDRPEGEGSGRGGKSPYCEDCRIRRRRAAQEVRSLRHAIAAITELVAVDLPNIVARRAAVTEAQDGHCADCNRRRRLYAVVSEDGSQVGVCVECHERRRTA